MDNCIKAVFFGTEEYSLKSNFVMKYWLEVITKTRFEHTVKPVYNDHPRDPKLWPLLTGCCCSKVALCHKTWKWDPKMLTCGRYLDLIVYSSLTVYRKKHIKARLYRQK